MAEKETKTVDTKVEQVNVDLDDIFNAAPGGDSITLPEETTEKKPNIFSRKKKVDTSFLYESNNWKGFLVLRSTSVTMDKPSFLSFFSFNDPDLVITKTVWPAFLSKCAIFAA